MLLETVEPSEVLAHQPVLEGDRERESETVLGTRGQRRVGGVRGVGELDLNQKIQKGFLLEQTDRKHQKNVSLNDLTSLLITT